MSESTLEKSNENLQQENYLEILLQQKRIYQ